jgi:predicted MFS family arabinose efflux permease
MSSSSHKRDAVRTELPAHPPQAPSRYAWYVLTVLCLVGALNFLDRQVLNILIDPIKAEFHASDTQMGLLTGFGFALFYFLFGIPIARWADVGPRRLILAVGLSIWSLMTALSGMAQAFWQLAGARIGIAVGETTGTPVSHSIISDYFPHASRTRAMAIYATSLYFGVFLGYSIGGWASQLYGWRTAFFLAGTPGIIVAVLFLATVKDPPRGSMDGPRADTSVVPVGRCLQFMAGQRSLILVVSGLILATSANMAFSAWSPSFLRRVHHMQGGEIGTWLGAINGTAGVLGTLASGYIIGRLRNGNDRWIVLWPAIITVGASPALAAFVLMPTKTTALLSYWVANLFLGFHLGPCFAMVQSLTKARMRALASSLTNLLSALLGALGPAAVGLVSEQLSPQFGALSLRYAMLIPVAAPVLGAACFYYAARFIQADLIRTQLHDDRFDSTVGVTGLQNGPINP